MFEIRQKDFLLREFSVADQASLTDIADAMNRKEKEDKNYYAYYALAVPYQANDYRKKLNQKIEAFLEKNALEMRQNPRITYRMAICAADAHLIGGMAIDMAPHFNQNKQPIYGDLGYFIAPEEGGRGIIPLVVQYVLNIYFKKFERLDFTIHPNNFYSKRVAEKLNAKQVGFIEKSGYENQPRVQYCLLKKDFESIRTVCRSNVPIRQVCQQNQRS